MQNPRRPYERQMQYNAPERPPRAFSFKANGDYCQLGLEPEIHFKVHLDLFSRKCPLEHAELLTYAAFDPNNPMILGTEKCQQLVSFMAGDFGRPMS